MIFYTDYTICEKQSVIFRCQVNEEKVKLKELVKKNICIGYICFLGFLHEYHKYSLFIIGVRLKENNM